jgi:hypothetical protein
MIRSAFLLAFLAWMAAPGIAYAQTLERAAPSPPAAAPSAQTPPPAQDEPWRQVAKWKITYADATLGEVHGVAYCDWGPPNWRSAQVYRDTGAGPHCRVLLDNPSGGARLELTAENDDITTPGANSSAMRLRLHGASPEGRAISPPGVPGQTLGATAGSPAKIRVKIDNVETVIDLATFAPAQADTDIVTLDLAIRADGSMEGRWSYLADPLTERGPQGRGRAGSFTTLRDGDTARLPAPSRPGGFLALQSGFERWVPLSPRFRAVHVIEDQAAFDSGRVKYPRATGGKRHLLIAGSNLPIHDGKLYAPIRDKKYSFVNRQLNEGLQYTRLADYRAKNISPANRQMIERGLATVTADMDADDAARLRNGDVVLLETDYIGNWEAGPQSLAWGDAEASWMLQYGDNTANVQFVRTIRRQDQPGAPRSSEREIAPRLVLPERVQIEVRTAVKLRTDTIPIVVGGPALAGKTFNLVASRVGNSMDPDGLIYRTPFLVFAEFGIYPDDAGSSQLVWAKQNAAVFAKVDDSSTNFLRANPASIMNGPPQRTWLPRDNQGENGRQSG